MSRMILITVGALFAAVATACSGGGDATGPLATLNPADFHARIDNPLFPLSGLGPKVFEGEERDPETGDVLKTRLESTVLDKTEVVAGVDVTVLEEKAYQNGELIEVALDYFAQHRDGSVYYFGERVDNYEDGKIANHDGQWLSGDGDNLPGIIMAAQPVAGQVLEQEHAPGIAEDKSQMVALDQAVTTPAGAFHGCLKTDDYSNLDDPVVHEFKYFCPGVGLVREEPPEGTLDLMSY